MARALLLLDRLSASLYPRIAPDLRASRARFARGVTRVHLILVGVWLAGVILIAVTIAGVREWIGWHLIGIAALALVGAASRWLLDSGRLNQAGYLLSSTLFLFVVISALRAPAYVMFFGSAFFLSILVAAAIISGGAPYLFAGLSVLANVGAIAYAREVAPSSLNLDQPGALTLFLLMHAAVSFSVAAVANTLSRQVERTLGSMHEQADQMARLAHTDPLTGLANRRHLLERLEGEFARAKRYRRHFSLLYIDLDGFKAINDRFGHLFGDEILRGSALAMQAVLRSTDLLGRIGGDEFAVLLPETSVHDAEHVVNKLRRALSAYGKQLSPTVPPLTLSVGVGEIREDDEAIEDILARADKAQYLAKTSGRALTRTQEDLEAAAEVD